MIYTVCVVHKRDQKLEAKTDLKIVLNVWMEKVQKEGAVFGVNEEIYIVWYMYLPQTDRSGYNIHMQ